MSARLDRDRPAGGYMPRNGMGAACSVGHSDLQSQPRRGNTAMEILEQRLLGAKETRAAGDVEPDSVGRIR